MKIKIFLIFTGLLLASFNAQAQMDLPYEGKKILFINSYHEGYEWSDGVTEGIKNVLLPKVIKNMSGQTAEPSATDTQLKIVLMDTKRNTSEVFKHTAALKVKAEIEAFQPDVVIASDDNAAKYVIMPFYKDTALPFVFCGVNWDASDYGFPYSNVTGMVEVDLADQILKHLKDYAKGERIGLIGVETESAHKIMENYRKVFGIAFTQTYFLTDFEAWKAAYLRAQEEVDMLFILSHVGLTGWDDEQAQAFVEANTRIPSGSAHHWDMPYALLGIAKVPQEQGLWAAQTALSILNGTQPSDIPLTTNKQGRLMLNLRLAGKLGIFFKLPLLKLADIIR